MSFRSASDDQALEDLWACWRESPEPSVKLTSYFPAYVRLFGHLRGTRCTFVETGVLDGGSLFMWRRWLGEGARIIGVELNPEATKWRDHGFEIIIGDQGDREFWRRAFTEIGDFDALLDDGGHQSFQQIVTATEAVRAAKRPCVIVVEDTGTSFMRDFARHGRHSFVNFAKDLTEVLMAPLVGQSRDRFPSRLNVAAVEAYGAVKSIEFFCGIVALRCDPDDRSEARVVRNRDANVASDFRYRGLDRAKVLWPTLFAPRNVVVKGGINTYTKVQIAKSRFRKLVTLATGR